MSKTKVLCIAGGATHGKTLTANVLKEILEDYDKNVLILSYANYLKYMCKQYFGWNGLKDEAGRTLLQRVGTNLARGNNPDIWVNVIGETILALHTEYDVFILDDARFPNEIIDLIEKFNLNVRSLKVNRLNYTGGLTEEQLNHPSETAFNDYEFDYYINFEDGFKNVQDSLLSKKELLDFLLKED